MDSPRQGLAKRLAGAPGERWSPRALLSLMWPLLIEQLLAVSIGMVDVVMVAGVGEAAVSGVSLVDAVNVLLITAFTALATGGAVVVSQYLGRREGENAGLAARQLVYAITLVSVVVAVLLLIFRTGLLRLVYGHIAADVMEAASTYMWLSALSYPFIGLYNAGAAIFRSGGNSRMGMLVAFIVNVLNIGGNSLFIYGFGMGVAGAALSTLISRMVAAVVLIVALLRRRAGPVSLRGLFRFQFSGRVVRQILKVGIPNGVENSLFQIGKLMVARIVSTFGTAAIAANAIAGNITTIPSLIGQAFGLAMLTVVGQCVGAGDYASARRNVRRLLIAANIGVLILCTAIFLLRGPVLGAFNLSETAIEQGMTCLAIFCIPAPFIWCTSFALPNALRAAGDARFTMVVSMLSMWIFRIGTAFLLAYGLGMGVPGVWVAMVVDWIARAIAFALRWRSRRWESKKLI